MSVVIIPSLFVLVVSIVRGDFLEGRGEVVVDESGFKLGGGDARGGADDKNRDQSAMNARSPGSLDDVGGQIKHLVLTLRLHVELLRKNRHGRNCNQARWRGKRERNRTTQQVTE